jgi:hypothetical protein
MTSSDNEHQIVVPTPEEQEEFYALIESLERQQLAHEELLKRVTREVTNSEHLLYDAQQAVGEFGQKHAGKTFLLRREEQNAEQ